MFTRSIAPAILLLGLAACGATPKAPQQVGPAKPIFNANPPDVAVVAPGRPAPPRLPDLPEEAPLDGYVVTFDRQPSYAVGSLSDAPVELEDGTLQLVSFGRRLEVRGQTAKILDRRENPQYRYFMAVPASAGGGYVFASKRGLYFAKTFGGTPIALTLPATMQVVERHTSIAFSYNSVLIRDPHVFVSAETDDSPEGYSYVSLTDGRPRNLGVVGAQQFAGTPSGRLAILDLDGNIFFAASEAEPPRRLDLPKAYGLDVVGGEIIIADQTGAYRLDPAQSDRSQMPLPSPSNLSTSFGLRSRNATVQGLRGRSVDAKTVGELSGTALSLYSLLGTPSGTVDVVKGSKDRYCTWLGGEGPLRFSCRSDHGISVHLFDPVAKSSKLERAFSRKKNEDIFTFADAPHGQVFARGRCDGTLASHVICWGAPGGYREIDLLPSLQKAGLVAPGTTPEMLRYSFFNSPVGMSDDGRAVMLVVGGSNDDLFNLVLSDGRTRSFPLASLPRRFRAILGRDKSAIYIDGDTVYGLLDSGMESEHPLKTGGVLRVTAPAISFSLPLSGEPKVAAFNGLFGRAGARFLRLDASGTGLLLSTDLGRTTVPVAGPPGLAIEPASIDHALDSFCADVGCTVGPWIRYGWGKAPQPPVP